MLPMMSAVQATSPSAFFRVLGTLLRTKTGGLIVIYHLSSRI
jgi:hypothetical protein